MGKIQVKKYDSKGEPNKARPKRRRSRGPKVYFHLFVNGRTRSPVVVESKERRVDQPGARFIARYTNRDNAYRDSACIRRDARNAAEIARGYRQTGAIMRAERQGDYATADKLRENATPVRIRR